MSHSSLCPMQNAGSVAECKEGEESSVTVPTSRSGCEVRVALVLSSSFTNQRAQMVHERLLSSIEPNGARLWFLGKKKKTAVNS